MAPKGSSLSVALPRVQGRAVNRGAAAALVGLAFSLYLARIEAHVLGVWCIYCVISLGDISLITLLALATTLAAQFRKPSELAS